MWISVPTPTQVCVASVRGASVNTAVTSLIDQCWDVEIVFLSSVDRGWGVTSAYVDPGSLGVDRFAAMVGAQAGYEGAKVIVDCGTAVTVDVLAADGRHMGGVILPGTELMRSVLFRRTDKIPPGAGLRSDILANNTSSAVVSGTILAVTGAIESVVENARARLGADCRVLITGGGAAEVASALRMPVCHDDDLVLRGIALMGGAPQ